VEDINRKFNAGMPPYLLIQHPWFTSARKINLKIKETFHRFKIAHQARTGHNMLKSSSPNEPSA
jgi:hypothetical protein